MVHGHVIRAVKTETTYYRLALFFIKEVFLILFTSLLHKVNIDTSLSLAKLISQEKITRTPSDLTIFCKKFFKMNY